MLPQNDIPETQDDPSGKVRANLKQYQSGLCLGQHPEEFIQISPWT